MSTYSLKVPIREWAEGDQPREKLMTKGRSALSDAELMAILLGSGSIDQSAVELAKSVLQSVSNNLDELGKLNIDELKKFKGIGEAKAITIIAAMEFGRRRQSLPSQERKKILSSNDVFNAFLPHLIDLPHEEFWIATLNRANIITSMQMISRGGTTHTVVDTKVVLKFAIEKLASGVVLCHNHPSGNINPSQEDIYLTKKIKSAFALIDINLLDHLIIGEKSYYSFADQGVI